MPLARPGRPSLRALAHALAPLLACAPAAPPAPAPAAPPAPADAPSQAAASPPPAAADAATTTLRGKLVHRPYDSHVKSVQAFTGAEFYLATDDARELVLRPTDAVDAAALAALAGQQVTVEATHTEGELPSPQESYPTEPDGGPMRRGAGWQVRAIRPGG